MPIDVFDSLKNAGGKSLNNLLDQNGLNLNGTRAKKQNVVLGAGVASVATNVAKATNGLKDQLDNGAKNRVKY